MKELQKQHRTFTQITLDISTDEVKIKDLQVWLNYYQIVAKIVNIYTIRILNGCIPSIHLYPEKMKLMFQENGRNFIITSNEDKTIVALIKGDMTFRKTGE